ncbi:MAG TPA: type II toxin-antitoxin system RatA family toxin [Rhizomicrobium sp.]
MTEHRETRRVPCTADLMFAVVADVEKYPQFLPWVVALRVLSRAQEDRREILTAEMAVGYHALRERYTSRVILDAAARKVDVVQIAGPFRQLENHWRFIPQGENCDVEFSITFAFKNRLLAAAAGKAFGKVMMRMSAAFEARAKALIGFPSLHVASQRSAGNDTE